LHRVTAGETGTVELTWTLPDDAAFADSTFLRLRFFGGSVDEPLPTDFADAGEVEDWTVQVLPAPEPPPEPPAPEPPAPARPARRASCPAPAPRSRAWWPSASA